ncbi:MAG TPA: hypothetical protein VFA43_04715 [Gemmatimonadaceae bacterium]|nr:hypothetical protein [Gemmatimonadaceae bacterium]
MRENGVLLRRHPLQYTNERNPLRCVLAQPKAADRARFRKDACVLPEAITRVRRFTDGALCPADARPSRRAATHAYTWLRLKREGWTVFPRTDPDAWAAQLRDPFLKGLSWRQATARVGLLNYLSVPEAETNVLLLGA